MVVGITGGIGSGKSVVSRILRCRGYRVYDCDLEAKSLMDESAEVQRGLCRICGEEAVRDGVIDRAHVACVVFSNAEKLAALNHLVHSEVRRDLEERIEKLGMGETLFVESAILFTSGLDKLCDRVLLVEAPVDTRIARAMRRDGADRGKVEERIRAQVREEELCRSHQVTRIVNDGEASLLLQLKDY